MFSLEDSASRAAKEYLDQLEAFYSRKESGAEVMEGIEERMAELLLEKSGKGGVVTLAMVNDVISVLGRPETIEEETSDAPDAEPAEVSRRVASTGSATDVASHLSVPSNLYGIRYPFSSICLSASSADPSTLNSKI